MKVGKAKKPKAKQTSSSTGQKIVVVDTGSANLEHAPIYNIYAHLVYSTAEARDTIVGGMLIVRDKRVLTIDWQRLRRQVREQSDRITLVAR